MKMQSIDLVAATFRNAMFEASGMNLMQIEEDEYDQFDAQILERCYRATDAMPQDDIATYAQCINLGAEIGYSIEKEDFYVIM